MERKFMVYQCRDGFQIAEEATGTRLENGMEFLARPNKSGLWCTAAFNVVIDDNYELVGEEVIDCSHQPVQVLCFVDGVMKAIDQSRITIEDMIEHADDAISDRNIPAARAWKIDIDAAIEQCHAEALEMDAEFNKAHQDDFFSATPMMQAVWVNLNHAEALEMNNAQKNAH